MILMYHKVDLVTPTEWWVDAGRFYQQILELRDRKFVYLDEYDPKDPSHVVVTFDGIYRNVRTYAGPILKKFGVPFELFLSGDHVGQSNEFDSVEPTAEFCSLDDLKALVEAGGRLQWHSKTHRRLDQIETEELQDELDVPENLKSLDPNGFRWCAYPHGAFNEAVLRETKKFFAGGISVIQGNNEDRYRYNRLTVVNETSFKRDKVSVIIASYNYGRFLSEAIESVLRQTFPPDEILISDDFSDDSTQEVAEYYSKQFPDLVRYRRNDRNLGIIDHFNLAVSECRGDLICILGADNRMASNYVEECVGVLHRHPEVQVAYTNYTLFGPRAKMIHESYPPFMQGARKLDFFPIIFPEYNLEDLRRRNFIHGSSFFRKSAFAKVDGYKAKELVPEDYNLFLRICSQVGPAMKAGLTFLEYRQHSSGQANIQLASAMEFRFLQKSNTQLRTELQALQDRIKLLESTQPEFDPIRLENRVEQIITNPEQLRAFRIFFEKNLAEASWLRLFKRSVQLQISVIKACVRKLLE